MLSRNVLDVEHVDLIQLVSSSELVEVDLDKFVELVPEQSSHPAYHPLFSRRPCFFPRAFLTAENPVPDCIYTGQSPDVHGQQTVFILASLQICKIHLCTGVGGGEGWWWGCRGGVVWAGHPKVAQGRQGPSMSVVVEAGTWRRLHAKDRMAAADKCAAHREIQAWQGAGRRRMGMDWILWRDSNRSSVAASVLHLPPSSMATTTSLARPPPTSSGYVLSLALLAMRSAVPAVVCWWRRGSAWDVSGETKVVSMANWYPFHKESPLAMTSIRRSSVRELWAFKSRSRTLVQTDASVSRQMRAIARSIATPLDRRAPERGHAARWSRNGSSERWHLHLAGMCGKGSRSRRITKPGSWKIQTQGQGMLVATWTLWLQRGRFVNPVGLATLRPKPLEPQCCRLGQWLRKRLACCHPLSKSRGASGSWTDAGGGVLSGQGGVAKPMSLRKVWTWEIHWIVGRVGAGACKWRSTSWKRSGVLLCNVFAASCQDAQKAAALWWKALRRPRPPRRVHQLPRHHVAASIRNSLLVVFADGEVNGALLGLRSFSLVGFVPLGGGRTGSRRCGSFSFFLFQALLDRSGHWPSAQLVHIVGTKTSIWAPERADVSPHAEASLDLELTSMSFAPEAVVARGLCAQLRVVGLWLSQPARCQPHAQSLQGLLHPDVHHSSLGKQRGWGHTHPHRGPQSRHGTQCGRRWCPHNHQGIVMRSPLTPVCRRPPRSRSAISPSRDYFLFQKPLKGEDL